MVTAGTARVCQKSLIEDRFTGGVCADDVATLVAARDVEPGEYERHHCLDEEQKSYHPSHAR